jgi:hypothetical protein
MVWASVLRALLTGCFRRTEERCALMSSCMLRVFISIFPTFGALLSSLFYALAGLSILLLAIHAVCV